MRETFHLFAYGTLRADPVPAVLDGCERVGTGTVTGTLYDLGEYPALLPGGDDPVTGTIWRCPAERLPALDRYEGVAEGLFRRVGLEVGEYGCWAYVAGPALGKRLVPEARIDGGSPDG